MNYDFDKPITRRGTGCVKWDEMPAGDVIPLWVADMDFPAAPAIRRAMQQRMDHGVFGYTMVQPGYYDAIVSWFHRRHAWDIQREWIQYTTGVVPAISAVIRAMTQPGDEVVVLTPVYNCFFSSIRNQGCRTVEVPLTYHGQSSAAAAKGSYTIDFDALESALASDRARLLLFCNPHNPAARLWTRDELLRVSRLCLDHGVVVVSDEIHCEFTYCGQRYQPFATVSDEARDNSVICTAASKAFNIAGLQTANIICTRPEWRQKIDRAINDMEICDLNPFGPVALEAAYNESEAWLDQLNDHTYRCYTALCDHLAAHLPEAVVTPLEATYLAWVNVSPYCCRLGLDSRRLCERLRAEARVALSAGTLYGTAGEGFVRVNMACPQPQLMEGLERMTRFMGADKIS
ncbi:MAG: pyridoxal phosphate-dependent aminotransferase [Prevotella sp.]|nr:pyridoxal phosphate-dependent aminotransferase [Prevotella sp.]